MRWMGVVVVFLASACAQPASALTVRPGTPVDGCTLGFAFAGSDGGRYMGLAGHCVVDDGTQRSWPLGDGPAARMDTGGQVIGRVVYAIWNQDALNPQPLTASPALPLAADFALVRLGTNVTANPSVCHFGGPVGIDAYAGRLARVVHYYGNGLGVGRIQGRPVLPARTGLAVGFADPRQVALRGLISSGDSGMPVLDGSGRAIGWLSHLGNPAARSDVAPVVRIALNVRLAEHALAIGLALRTAPIVPSAPAFGHDDCP